MAACIAERMAFDEVVFACHGDQVLALLAPGRRIGQVLRELGYLDERSLAEAVAIVLVVSFLAALLVVCAPAHGRADRGAAARGRVLDRPARAAGRTAGHTRCP